jgi:hypothetical protein
MPIIDWMGQIAEFLRTAKSHWIEKVAWSRVSRAARRSQRHASATARYFIKACLAREPLDSLCISRDFFFCNHATELVSLVIANPQTSDSSYSINRMAPMFSCSQTSMRFFLKHCLLTSQSSIRSLMEEICMWLDYLMRQDISTFEIAILAL